MLISVSACGSSGGGGSEGEEAPELVRVIHAANGVAALDVQVDNENPDPNAPTERVSSESSLLREAPIQFERVSYGQASAFVDILEGSRTFTVRTQKSAAPLLVQEEQEIEAGKTYSYILVEAEDALTGTLVEEDGQLPTAGSFRLHIGNFAASQESVDVYVVQPNTSLQKVTPASSALAYQGFSDYFDVEVGTWSVKFTAPGLKAILESSGDKKFTAGKSYTLLLLDERNSNDLTTALYTDF